MEENGKKLKKLSDEEIKNLSDEEALAEIKKALKEDTIV